LRDDGRQTRTLHALASPVARRARPREDPPLGIASTNLETSMADTLVAAVAGLGVGVITVLALQDTHWPRIATMAFPLVAAASATTIQNIMMRFSRS
jgi:hypothetical protein